MVGVKINGNKTEVMKISDDPTPLKVTVAGVPLAETKSFKYLGSLFNSEASCDEVKSRQIARQRMGELVPIWKSRRTISIRLKARLIKAYCHIRLEGMDIE